MKVFPVEIIIDGKDVSYKLLEEQSILEHTVPKGFVSDGCSSFRLSWVLFPPVQDYFPSCVLHDYLLDCGYGWKYCEQQFKRSLKQDGVDLLRRTIMVNAVRAWGIITGKRKVFE